MLIEKREMRKSLIPIIALYVFGVALKAQELSSLSFDEVCVAESQSDVVYDAYDQFDTTVFSETFFLYDAVTGNPTGEMVYKNGSYYMERNGVRTLLTRSDLLRMFSSEQFRDYSKAKRQWGAKTPLFFCPIRQTGRGLGALLLRPALSNFCFTSGAGRGIIPVPKEGISWLKLTRYSRRTARLGTIISSKRPSRRGSNSRAPRIRPTIR